MGRKFKVRGKRAASQTNESAPNEEDATAKSSAAAPSKTSEENEEVVTRNEDHSGWEGGSNKRKRTKSRKMKEDEKEKEDDESRDSMAEDDITPHKSITPAAAQSASADSSSSSSSSSSMVLDSLGVSTSHSTTGSDQKDAHMKKCSACGAWEPREIAVPAFIRQAEAAAAANGVQVTTTEIGRLIFHYRPKVDVSAPKSVDDVQRLYIVMEALATPLGDEARIAAEYTRHHAQNIPMQTHHHEPKDEAVQWSTHVFEPSGLKHIRRCEPKLFRLAVLPGKALPQQKGRSGTKLALITDVSPDPSAVIDEMREKSYHTKTRGDRVLEKTRVVAEAVYFIVRMGGRRRHARLMFRCEVPSEDEHHKSIANTIFHIPLQGSYNIQVKNPHTKGTPIARSPQMEFPEFLQRLFAGARKDEVRFIAADPPALLNYKNTQMLLSFAGDDLQQQYDELAQALEDEEKEDMEDWEKIEHEKLIHDLYLEQEPTAVVDASSAQRLV